MQFPVFNTPCSTCFCAQFLRYFDKFACDALTTSHSHSGDSDACISKRVVVKQCIGECRETYIEDVRSVSLLSNANRVALCLAIDRKKALPIFERKWPLVARARDAQCTVNVFDIPKMERRSLVGTCVLDGVEPTFVFEDRHCLSIELHFRAYTPHNKRSNQPSTSRAMSIPTFVPTTNSKPDAALHQYVRMYVRT